MIYKSSFQRFHHHFILFRKELFYVNPSHFLQVIDDEPCALDKFLPLYRFMHIFCSPSCPIFYNLIDEFCVFAHILWGQGSVIIIIHHNILLVIQHYPHCAFFFLPFFFTIGNICKCLIRSFLVILRALFTVTWLIWHFAQLLKLKNF